MNKPRTVRRLSKKPSQQKSLAAKKAASPAKTAPTPPPKPLAVAAPLPQKKLAAALKPSWLRYVEKQLASKKAASSAKA